MRQLTRRLRRPSVSGTCLVNTFSVSCSLAMVVSLVNRQLELRFFRASHTCAAPFVVEHLLSARSFRPRVMYLHEYSSTRKLRFENSPLKDCRGYSVITLISLASRLQIVPIRVHYPLTSTRVRILDTRVARLLRSVLAWNLK